MRLKFQGCAFVRRFLIRLVNVHKITHGHAIRRQLFGTKVGEPEPLLRQEQPQQRAEFIVGAWSTGK